MRIVVATVLVVTSFASLVHADDRTDVEGVVRAQVKDLHDRDKVAATLAPDALVVVGNTPEESSSIREKLYGQVLADTKFNLGKLNVVVDDRAGVAWFQGPIDVTISEDRKSTKDPLRISGVALKDGRWKIAAVMYSRGVPDKQLLDNAAPPATDAPKLTGDPALAKAVAAWFPGGLAKAASSGPVSIVHGTAPSEYQIGAAATGKLAKVWDGLKIAATSVHAKTWKNAIGFVRVTARLPSKKSKFAASLELAAIAVQDKGEWRWVSLHWSQGYWEAP